ncbi:hypothetical protein P22_3735 [Propionispora sp. 2/2-37]|uniref:ribulose-phosphate 3-epimerase n=1 Tax=Propionispora sp. 2/2-37 TaxID=1677858 RepID=UPI0006BB8041|nr:ribulose-phosphate 3-epimerase [Propionispora sp. 2/2-37]CUH97604.1 hypothetical protein P22_3735 [Propionispora sp. 2/2-37]
MSVVLSPSLLAADMGYLAQEIQILEENNITALHIDVMDGNFVPNIAFGPDQIKMLRPLTKMKFDTHLMVMNPERYIQTFADAGADLITVHAEACIHLHKTIQMVRSSGKQVGVALNPATPLEVLDYMYDLLDLVLIMTVNPGYGGQKHIVAMQEKIAQLLATKQSGRYGFEIQVDGGINAENIQDVVKAGAHNIVVGSSLFQKGKTRDNVQALAAILEKYNN